MRCPTWHDLATYQAAAFFFASRPPTDRRWVSRSMVERKSAWRQVKGTGGCDRDRVGWARCCKPKRRNSLPEEVVWWPFVALQHYRNAKLPIFLFTPRCSSGKLFSTKPPQNFVASTLTQIEPNDLRLITVPFSVPNLYLPEVIFAWPPHYSKTP